MANHCSLRSASHSSQQVKTTACCSGLGSSNMPRHGGLGPWRGSWPSSPRAKYQAALSRAGPCMCIVTGAAMPPAQVSTGTSSLQPVGHHSQQASLCYTQECARLPQTVPVQLVAAPCPRLACCWSHHITCHRAGEAAELPLPSEHCTIGSCRTSTQVDGAARRRRV